MSKTVAILLAVLLLGGTAVQAQEEGSTGELQHRLDDHERRIEQLERALEALQGQPPATHRKAGMAAEAGQRQGDPLLGTWQCTNNVFTYNMTFLSNGQLLQETPTFGPMRELAWTRLSDFEILLTGGIKLLTRLRNADEMTVDNLNNQAKWDCRRQSK